MILAIACPKHSRNVLLCRQFWGIAIATEAALVAIQEQIRCKRGQAPGTGPTGKRNAPRSESSGPWMCAPASSFEPLVAVIGQAPADLAAHVSRAVNASLTLRNWLIGFHIAEHQPIGESLTPQLVESLLPQRESNILHMTSGESGSGEEKP